METIDKQATIYAIDCIQMSGKETWYDLYRKVLETISAMPPVQTETHWIPVTREVPRESGFYVVSGNGKMWICEFVTMFGICGWKNSVSNPVVSAWLPKALPEPYKE